MSYLSDEYKILQDKLDKIGGFRFTIKGWSVTAVIGGLIAAATGKTGLPNVVAIVLDICLVGFFLFERQQVQLSRRFGRRALDIEEEVDVMRRRDRWKSQFSSPRIASSILRGRPFELVRRKFGNPTLERYRNRVNEEVRIAKSSDVVFYLVLMTLVWLPLWFSIPQAKEPAAANITVYGSAINREGSAAAAPTDIHRPQRVIRGDSHGR